MPEKGISYHTISGFIKDCHTHKKVILYISVMFFFIYFIFTIFRVLNMINQFTEGLNACGKLWDTVKTNWIDFLPIFTKTDKRISRSSFRALFEISWSAKDTKRREQEKETIYYWELVLKMIEGECHLLDISSLFFHVSAYSIPEPEVFGKAGKDVI